MIKILAVSLLALSTVTARAEPLQRSKGYCSHLSLMTFVAHKCIWLVVNSVGKAKDAMDHRIAAESTTDPDEKQKLLNRADYELAEANRLADKYRRLYAPK